MQILPKTLPKTEPKASGSVADVLGTFFKLGLTSFGGPIAHIGYFRKELVENKHWVSESQFSQLLAVCQFLPGPASSQLGFALGFLRAGWLGALAAFFAFTLPSVLLLVGFAAVLPLLSTPVGEAAIHGLKLVACAVVADAVLGMSQKLCADAHRRAIALLSACVLLVAGSAWLQILVVMVGALAGIVFCREPIVQADTQIHVKYPKRLGVILLAVFFVLLVVLPLLSTPNVGLLAMADVFYRAGALVFGGGHVVLPLLEDSTVAAGWISKDSFLAGYGAAQAIPGPLFAFSAYLGAVIPTEFNTAVGALVALTFMFLPGFLLISAVLPLWQGVSHSLTTRNAVAGVNAAVVGLLGAALYDPILTSGITSDVDLLIALIALGLLRIWESSPLAVVGWCVLANVTYVTLL